ncbi:MAG: hypothetical protein ACPGF7_06995 [Pontibacterium sp.]
MPLLMLPFLLCLFFSNTINAEPEDWAITAYHNVLTADPLEEQLIAMASYDTNYQLTALAITKQIPLADPRMDLEWEGQLVKHVKGQDHHEINGLMAVRWYPLPWDHYLDIDVAAGLGLSYATQIPEFEALHHSRADKVLAYILLELEAKPKGWHNWSLVLRSHHRSGAFGLINNVHGASNSMGLGIKYRF